MRKRLGELLVGANLITTVQLEHALSVQHREGGRLGYRLVELDYLKESDLTNFLSTQYGVPAIHLAQLRIDPRTIRLVPKELAEKYGVLPVSRQGATLTLAMIDPGNDFARDEIRFLTGYNVTPVVANEMALLAAIKAYYDPELVKTEDRGTPPVREFGACTVKILPAETRGEEARRDSRSVRDGEAAAALVERVLLNAVAEGADSIHWEPDAEGLKIRFRKSDGLVRQTYDAMPDHRAVIDRLAVLAGLDGAEPGGTGFLRLSLTSAGRNREIEAALAFCQVPLGIRAVLRLSGAGRGLVMPLEELGMEPEALAVYRRAVLRHAGLVLVSGLRHCGKTTTLYSTLAQLNRPDLNLMTLEETIECRLDGITQCRLRPGLGSGARTSLADLVAQEPDIVMVGALRDRETANIAAESAIDGCLTLAAIACRDAVGVPGRLIALGVVPKIAADALSCVTAQRLAGRLCAQCRYLVSSTETNLIELGFSDQETENAELYRDQGCHACRGGAGRGRIGLFQVMEVTEALKECIRNGGTQQQLREIALNNGMIGLRRSGIHKIMQGLCSIEEVVSVTERS